LNNATGLAFCAYFVLIGSLYSLPLHEALKRRASSELGAGLANCMGQKIQAVQLLS
jgi:hypothetical protein